MCVFFLFCFFVVVVFCVRVFFCVFFFLSFKTMSSQNIRYTSFMQASGNDHSNFRIFKFTYRCIGCDLKRGLQKLLIHISSRIIFNSK